MIISDEIRQQILTRLLKLECEHTVRVLFAIETGSRAWGFASTSSDYDVRFIYAHPRDWYLSLKEGRDVIETTIEDVFDIQGWDVRKALRLFAKSNPPLNEWLRSPHVYLEKGFFAPRLRQLAEEFYSHKGVVHHYLHMAQREHHSDFHKGEQVILKKYLYIVRPLLNILWIRDRQTIPPISMMEIMNGIAIPDDVRTAIHLVVAQKQAGVELGRGAKIPVLDQFLASVFAIAEQYAREAPMHSPAWGTLDLLFREVVDTQ